MVTFLYIKVGDYDDLASRLNDLSVQQTAEIEVHITPAGLEYLDLISNHFEFFSIRSSRNSEFTDALFHRSNLKKTATTIPYKYGFEIIIEKVIEIVRKCAEDIDKYYEEYMFERYHNKNGYFDSPFVYRPNGESVFHCERVIHTHINYLDQYRMYIFKSYKAANEYRIINEKIVTLIEKYIEIGQLRQNICSQRSDRLFENMTKNISKIRSCSYNDYTTMIWPDENQKQNSDIFE